MFKSLGFVDQDIDNYYYKLIDSDFICSSIKIEKINNNKMPPNGSLGAYRIVSIITEYKSRNLNIPKNIALMYNNYYSITDTNWCDTHKVLVEKHWPQLNYEEKYYNCVVTKLKQLQFSNTKR